MNAEVNEPILEAMQIIADATVSKLRYDRTVQATIFRVVNVDEGTYEVRYDGNIVVGYAQDPAKRYKVDEDVFLKIPEGDPSNRKIITGRVSERSLSYSQLTQLSNQIIEVSPTFDNLYQYNTNEPWKICAGKGDTDYVFGSANSQYSSSQYHGLFQQYANEYEYIRIKASFKTQFHAEHTEGNYGLEVVFYTEGGEVKYRLDFESFNGDPYSFAVYSPQWVVFKAQKNYLLGLKYIRLFQENFRYDSQITNYETGARTNITTPNIFVKDVKIGYVEVQDLTKEPYYCYISAPQGSIFSASCPQIRLEARLLSYGEAVNDDKCIFQWFKRDLSITVSSDDYVKDAGFAWKKLPQTSKTLTLDKTTDDITYQARYMCLVVYNNDVVMKAEKQILNADGNYKYHIGQTTDGASIKLQLVNDKTHDVLRGNWYLSYPDGSYSQFPGGQNQNEISVEDYLVYTSVMFYCEVLSYTGNKIVGTIEHTIMNTESDADVVISYVGEDTFRYDANGDTAFTDTEKERTLQVRLAWKEGYGSSYTVDWIGPDKQTIPRAQTKPIDQNAIYNPRNSMMENIWIDNSNILHYNIRQKLKTTYNNNTFTIKITTIDKKVYVFQKEILFIKDGDQGTNGTTYIAAVRPCGLDGLKLSGFQALRYINGNWTASLRLGCFVYKDGEQINRTASNTNYTVSYKWEYTNLSATSDNTQQVVVRGSGGVTGPTANIERYVRVKVTINDHINSRNTTIYALYPVDVVVGSALDMTQIDISAVPSYIKYTASGVNPSFYRDPVQFLYRELDYTNVLETMNDKILDIDRNETDDEGNVLTKLVPASSFIFEVNQGESGIGLLKWAYTSTNYVIHPIILYLDTYGNEFINGWDGTKLAIDEANGQYLFAPMIGAGEKDSANRFTGVVMGKDGTSRDPKAPNTPMIGLYGYQQGINTFGLMQNGHAFFGRSGRGQIYIDGEEGSITSGNWKRTTSVANVDGDGMKITLSDGHIDAYNFLLTSRNMTLSSQQQSFEFKLGEQTYSKFRIYFPKGTVVNSDLTLSADKSVFLIEKGNYYLQSLDFTQETGDSGNGKGTKIDIAKGTITSYDFHVKTPTLTIDSGGNGNSKFTFDVSNRGLFNIYAKKNNSNKNLLYINGSDTSDKYYLQSLDYQAKTSTVAGAGTKIELDSGRITSYKFKLQTPKMTLDSDESNGSFEFDVSNSGKFDIYAYDGTTKKHLFYASGGDSSNQYYLASKDFKTGTSSTDGKGTKINLVTGKITSYSFHLDTPSLTIKSSNASSGNDDSTDTDTKGQFDFNVQNGGTFKVRWNTKNLLYILGGTVPTSDTGGDAADSGNFYLQSYDYSTSSKKGMRINLANGKINAYTFKLETSHLTIVSDDTGKFSLDVAGKGQFKVVDGSKNLIYIQGTDSRTAGVTTDTPVAGETSTSDGADKVGTVNSGSFYLQSHNYNTSNKTGTRIDMVSGKITSYDFTLKTTYIDLSSDSNGTFVIDLKNSGRFQIKDTTSGVKQKILFNVTGSSYYLQSQNYTNSSESSDGDPSAGMKINLKTGKLYAKDVVLTGKITASSGKIGGWYIRGNKLSATDSDGASVYLGTDGFKFDKYFQVSSSGLKINFASTTDEGDNKTTISSIKVNAQGIKLFVSETGQLSFTGYDGTTKSDYTQLSTYKYASDIEYSAKKISLSVSGVTTTLTKYDGSTETGSVNCYQKSETYTKSEVTTEIGRVKISVSGKTVTLTNPGGNSTMSLSDFKTESEVESIIDTTLKGIKLEVKTKDSSGNTTLSSIKLNAGGTIDLTGQVVFKSDLSTSGSTTIDGGNIKTGTLTADKLKALDQVWVGSSKSMDTAGHIFYDSYDGLVLSCERVSLLSTVYIPFDSTYNGANKSQSLASYIQNKVGSLTATAVYA